MSLILAKKKTIIRPSGNTGTNIVEDLWGVEISDFPEYYFTSDVPASQAEKIKESYQIASATWGILSNISP